MAAIILVGVLILLESAASLIEEYDSKNSPLSLYLATGDKWLLTFGINLFL